MKLASVSAVKRGKTEVVATLPRKGSHLREVHDRFLQNRGVPISFVTDKHGAVVRQLTDYYGLDIRNIEPGKWVLAGEWIGKNYVDYIAAVAVQE